MENLYNEAYSLLPMEEKKEILENLAKKYKYGAFKIWNFFQVFKINFYSYF